MKVFAFIFFGFIFWPHSASAQQLDSILWIDIPCFGWTGTAFTNQVPGANYYEWTATNSGGNVNSLWLNGAPGPVQTSSPNVNFAVQTISPFYVFCVTAYGPAGASNTFCDTMYVTTESPVFSASNPAIVNAGTSAYFAVDTPMCPVINYGWTITGDAAFLNGAQFILTSLPGVNINFGPGFTSGTLCAYLLNVFYTPGDTVCMTISAPLSVSAPGNNDFIINYSSSTHMLEVQLKSDIQVPLNLIVSDITGRKVRISSIGTPTRDALCTLSLPELKPGMYFITFSYNRTPFSVQSFVVTH